MEVCSLKNHVHIIRHLSTSTCYGFRLRKCGQSSIVCFKREKDAKHVMNSISTYKQIYNNNPPDKHICMYTKNELLNEHFISPYEYGLYVDNTPFIDLLNMLLNRNVGIFFIEEISSLDGDIKIQKSIEICPNFYEVTTEDIVKTIEEDYQAS